MLIAFYWKKNSHWYDPSENWDIGCGTYHGGRYVDQIHIDLEDMDAMWMPLPQPPKKEDGNVFPTIVEFYDGLPETWDEAAKLGTITKDEFEKMAAKCFDGMLNAQKEKK